MEIDSSLEVFSASFYDLLTTGECTGFSWNFLNSTSDKINSILTPLLTRIITLYLQPLCAVIGALGNLSFLFIVWKVPHMRNSTNIILLHLSVADLLFLLIGTAVKFVNVLKSPVLGDSYFIGHIYHCLIVIPLVNVVSFTSLLLISLISMERYLAVCKPHQYLKMVCRRRTSIYVTFVWVFSFWLAALLFPSTMDFATVCVQWPDTPAYASFPTKAGFCMGRNHFWSSLNEIVQILPFSIALILNIVCFTRIFPKLYGQMASKTPSGRRKPISPVTTTHQDYTNAATRMLLINGMAFFILATPFHVTSAIQFVESATSNWWCNCREFKDISVLFLYINSAVNPFIYGMTNRSYRLAYYSVFCNNIYPLRRSLGAVTPSDNQTEKLSTYV